MAPRLTSVTSGDLWDEQTAARYDDSSAQMFMPEVLGAAGLDLDLDLEQRVGDWEGRPFTSDSESRVSVWRKR